MRTVAKLLALPAVLLLLPVQAWAADGPAGSMTSPGAAAAPPEPEAAPPPGSQPAQPPPAPPSLAPPGAPSQAQPSTSALRGQWVYTQQYGWVWMPYGDAYTSVPPGGYGQPYQYLYYPAYGWTWVVAPWVWGFGPWPYFGFFGPSRFAWYGYGWWRNPWRWHLAATPYLGFRYGPRTAPHWGGFPHRAFIGGGVGFRHGAVASGHFGRGHR